MSQRKTRDELATLSTIKLLDKVGSGDKEALDVLCARYLPRLQRWARGRLPEETRGLVDTDDVVQDVLMQTLEQAPSFDPEHSGAFLGYARRAIQNRIRDELRRAKRKPSGDQSAGNVIDHKPSPLEEAIGTETLERYEAALGRLTLTEQAAITARLEARMTYEEIADELGKPTAGAARMAVSHALLRLAQEMKRLAQDR